MKTAIVIEIIVLCLLLTLFTVFTIDGAVARKAEYQQVINTDVTEIIEEYFDGKIETDSLAGVIKSAITESAHSNSVSTSVVVSYADSSFDVASVLIEITYQQPNGTFRTLSNEKVYIRERQLGLDSDVPYSFIRNINQNYYKTPTGVFIEPSLGGLKSDSIWRTTEYAAVLDAVLGVVVPSEGQ